MTRINQARAVVLTAMMVVSVVAIGGVGLAGAAVDSTAQEPIEVVSVDGVPTDPVLNESNNDDIDNLPRVNSGDESANPRRSTVTVNISVTNDDPLNITFTQAALGTGQNPYASGVDYGVGVATGGSQPGLTVQDGGPLDANSTAPDGYVEVELIVDADNAPDGGFENGENVSIAISDAGSNGQYQNGQNEEFLNPAVLVDERAGQIGDPDDDGANDGNPPSLAAGEVPVPGTDLALTAGEDNYSPDLVDAIEEESEDTAVTDRDAVHQGEQVRVIAQVNESQGELANVVANLTVAATGNPDRLSGVSEVQMYLDQNRDGEISAAEKDVDAIGPNGTYIGRFYVSPSAEPVSYVANINITDERGNTADENSTAIEVKARNDDVPNVYGQEGDNRVTVVFPNDVYTQSPAEGALTRQDFAYIDNNDAGATSIIGVSHEPGSKVAVLTLDNELGERDLVTSAFDSRRDNPQSDEIRVRTSEVFATNLDEDDAAEPVTGGPQSDQSIIEARTTATYSLAPTKQGEFPTPVSNPDLNPQTQRDVNPEEDIFLVAGVTTAQEQTIGTAEDGLGPRPGPAASFFVDDGTNTLTKDAVGNDLAEGAFPDLEVGGNSIIRLTEQGDLQQITPPNYDAGSVPGFDYAVVTRVDLSKLSASGAADGDLNVTSQATGEFRQDRQAVSSVSPVFGEADTNGDGAITPADTEPSTAIAPVGTRNLVSQDGYGGTVPANSYLTTTTVDHTRPAIQTAVVQANLNNDATVDIDFTEPVQSNDGNPLTAADFKYIDKNGAGATEIVGITDSTRGDEFVKLVLNRDVTKGDLNDEIRVVPNQIVDAESTISGDEVIEIGNPARDGLATDGVPLQDASVVPNPAVEVKPATVAGDGSIIAEADSQIGLLSGGVVSFQVIDSQGNFLDPDDDGQPESITVRDGGFAYIGPGASGTIVGVDLDGQANGEVTVRLEMDRIFNSGQAADGQATVYAEANTTLLPSRATKNLPTKVYQNTLSIDSQRPTIASVSGAVGTNQLEVTFTEGTFATENSHEELRADDFRYIDNDFAGASEITQVTYPSGETAGSTTVMLTLDRSLTQQDLIDDEISVEPDNIEDTVGNTLLVGSPTKGISGPDVAKVTVSATEPSGGSSTITAKAYDSQGNQLEGVDITLTTDAGTFSNGQQTITVTTIAKNNNYSATATLSGQISGATVTASANGESAQTTVGTGDGTGDGDGALFTQPIVSGGQAPTDTDTDGMYEDVNGDGTADFDDAVALAFADVGQLSAQQKAALDFDGDGDVDFDDAVELAFEV